MDATVCVGTFGDQHWSDLAKARAIPSAPSPVIHCHGSSLAAARNECLEQVETEWAIFLDADDELTPGYVEAMGKGGADLRAPRVSYQRKYRSTPRPPAFPRVAGHQHDCTGECLPKGNWLVIGTCVRTELLRRAGGWREWPLYEDWDAWLRCWREGGTVEGIEDAIYIAHVRFDSRNRAPDVAFKNRIHREIYAANFPELAAA